MSAYMAVARTAVRASTIELALGLALQPAPAARVARTSLSALGAHVRPWTATALCAPLVPVAPAAAMFSSPIVRARPALAVPAHLWGCRHSPVLRALSTSAHTRSARQATRAPAPVSPTPSGSAPAAGEPESGLKPESDTQRKKPLTQAVASLHAAKHGSAARAPMLSEDILTVPNALTASRLVMVPIIGWLILHGQMLPAAGLLFLAGLTDVLDGWIARRTGRLTVFGSIADPAADKGLMATMVVTLGLSGLLPGPLVALILARDVGLVCAAFVIRWRTLPPPKTLARYFDPSLPSVMAKPTTLSKYNTFLQLLLVGLATVLPALTQATEAATTAGFQLDHPALHALFTALNAAFIPLQWIVAATTAISGLQYLTGAGVSKVATAATATAASSSSPASALAKASSKLPPTTSTLAARPSPQPPSSAASNLPPKSPVGSGKPPSA